MDNQLCPKCNSPMAVFNTSKNVTAWSDPMCDEFSIGPVSISMCTGFHCMYHDELSVKIRSGRTKEPSAFKLTVQEAEGEREHSAEFLIYAPDLEAAEIEGRRIVREWFPDIGDDDVELHDDGDICHFFGGEIVVSIDGMCPTTKAEFIREYLSIAEIHTT